MPALASLCVASLVLASPHLPSPRPADFVLDALASHPRVFLGDIHPLAEPKQVVAEVIRRQTAATRIDILALEVAREQQPAIDRYLASVPEDTTILLEHPRTLRAHWGASAEYLAIYRAVYAWNRDHAAQPTRILAADLVGWPIAPLTQNMAAGGFANRDRWIADRLLTLFRAEPGARVLLFMGGYHGLRHGGGEVTVGRAEARFERWLAGYLGDAGVPLYSILSDATQESGHGATRLYDALAAHGDGTPFSVALDSASDAIAEPLHPVELDGYRLAFWPVRFRLRDAVDALIGFPRATPITVLEAFRTPPP